MEETVVAARFWCHMCSQMVNPIMEVEIKCPSCQSGFVEEMGSHDPRDAFEHSLPDLGSDRALSFWAPVLLGMMNNRRHRHRSVRRDLEQDEVEDQPDNGENQLDRELESLIRRRRSSSATVLQLLQTLRSERESELGSSENSDRNRERVILVNPSSQTIIVQGSSHDSNQGSVGSLVNYFIGPGLDLVLQHLAENDPNRYGTPPARKDAVEGMPAVSVGESVQCSVCLDDFEVGAEAREMPCKHKFHSECILPWLEIHSSCPVCRFQMPAEESKVESDGSPNSGAGGNRRGRHGGRSGGGEEGGGGGQRNVNGRRFPIPWPFSGLFSSSASQTGASSSNADDS